MIDLVLGLVFGDEAKGRMVDYLSDKHDIVVRFNGGGNSGHSIHFDGKKFILHLIPSGIFKDKINVIGNGCVLDPSDFKKELVSVKEYINIDKLYLSNKIHLITPFHILHDKFNEEKKGKNKIGSTLKGISPVYSDKISRKGIRLGDIYDDTLEDKFDKMMREYLLYFDYNEFNYDIDVLNKDIKRWFDDVEFLKIFNIINTEYFLNDELSNGTKILAEGAQGTLLDIDFGCYPFVTSSNVNVGSVFNGLGVPSKYLDKVYGVFKAYNTRVGNGPFPTYLNDEMGSKIQTIGEEYGATTGRPRMCGWLDLPLLKYATMINGVTDLVITKVDVLNNFDEIKVCTHYKINGKITDRIPYDLYDAEPIYQSFKGWGKIENNIIPVNLRHYIDFISEYLNTQISFVSYGKDRNSLLRI